MRIVELPRQVAHSTLSYFKGAVNLLSFTNLYSGEASLGDRLTRWTVSTEDSTQSPVPFAAGYASALVSELALPIYAITDLENQWPLLAIDAGIKIIPRTRLLFKKKLIR